MSLVELFARDNTDSECTKATCPASDSIYGYAPSLAASIILIIIFGVATIIFMVQGWKYRRSWLAFSIVFSLGCALETVGYIARLMLNNDPFSGTGFKLSVVLLTFAPAFMSGGIYLLLKHVCLAFGAHFSRLRPKLYTWIFVSCDIVSILLQAAGGALSAVAEGQTLLNIGVDIMIAGLAFQVITLVTFAVLAFDFFWTVRKSLKLLKPSSQDLASNRLFRLFIAAATVAYTAILIRCAYRVAELSGGWGNPIMRVESEFIVLESV